MMRSQTSFVAGMLTVLLSYWLAPPDPTPAAEIQAAVGRPFGVARITLPLRTGEDDFILETNGYRIEERGGRLFYPTVVHRRALGLVRELLGMQDQPPLLPSTVTVYFLFTGDEPLDVTFWAPEPQRFTIVPDRGPRIFQRLQRAWWQNYHAKGRLQEEAGDYPPLLETYLPRMLGNRLGLTAPTFNQPQLQADSIPSETLKLILNVETMRLQMMEGTLAGTVDDDQAMQPLPAEIEWPQSSMALPEQEPAIEPMAMRVPEECFYVRFGSFPNYLWLRQLLERNGGDVSRMVTLRGHDAQSNQRVQDQLGLKETGLAELFGAKLISDVALIGRDTYLREGAALGIVFEARNGLLKNELTKQRREAVERRKAEGATETTETILGQPVSFASTPDNRLRSFYVQVDRYHLVTTSRKVAERFVEASQGIRPLGAEVAFRAARVRYPVDQEATVFAYLSPAFFRGLVSPQYLVELRRRLRAATDLELVQMASWAAAHERLSTTSIQDLIRVRLLPPQFERRADGSRIVQRGVAETLADQSAESDQRVAQRLDSLRGARGTFLPIPDVVIERVTRDEAARCAEMARFHQQQWKEMDPLVLVIKKTDVNETGRERLEMEAEALPFHRQKYGSLVNLIGPATRTQIHQSDDDAVTIQCVLQGNGQLLPAGKPHHLFFGIQNRDVPIEFASQSLWRMLQILRTAPAYLGSWPELGLLDLLPLGRTPLPNAQGLTQLPFGLWRLQTADGFSLVGTNPDVLGVAADHLAVEEAAEPAQVRVHLMDVTQSRIQAWFAALDFQRAYQTSIGNTRLLNAMTMQLGIPPEQALSEVESLLDVQLVCALGGEYQSRSEPGGRAYWISTHWPSIRAAQGEKAAFASPATAWFRGLDLVARMENDRVIARATLEIQQPEKEKAKLPFFDFFRQ